MDNLRKIDIQIHLWNVDGTKYCLRKRDTPLQSFHIEETVKHGGGSLMFWDCMTTKALGYGCQVYDGTMKAITVHDPNIAHGTVMQIQKKARRLFLTLLQVMQNMQILTILSLKQDPQARPSSKTLKQDPQKTSSKILKQILQLKTLIKQHGLSFIMTPILAPRARDAAFMADIKTTYYTIANFLAASSQVSLELENINSF
ncbi:MAG: hypothetical protein J3R72DRAFT_499307 [Linnemannia gamsii]|nr:MAG: hypothetical protein J3R72DRAFT_499307 [Linnemannia gamsii]